MAPQPQPQPQPQRPTVPRYTSVMLIILGIYYIFWSIGLLPIILLWDVVHFYFSPFLSLSRTIHLLQQVLKPASMLPFTFNLSGLFNLLMKIFVLFPLGTFLWLIDEYILTDWKKVKIVKPLFILGQPRSGTTKLQSLMDTDQNFHCLRPYEFLAPFLSIQYLIRWIADMDSKYLNHALAKGIQERTRVNTNSSQSAKMRPIEITKAEEDDFMFQLWFHTGILVAAFFGEPEVHKELHNFGKNDPEERKKMMRLHSQIVQKSLFLNGNGTKRYMNKWVMGWNGEVQAAREFYPDAEYLVIVRDKHQAVPSWVKLVGLLAEDWTAYNFVNLRGETRDEFIRLTAEGYQQMIQFCKTIPPERIQLLKFEEFFADMPHQMKQIYNHFGWEMTKEFENNLIHQQNKFTTTSVGK